VSDAPTGNLAAALAGERCYVIAEAGSNHCGDLEVALQLVDVAADAGADAVKFQVFVADRMYPPGAGSADYLGMPESIEEIISALELPPEWIGRIAAHAAERHIDFLATPFDLESVRLLDEYVPAFKIASYELTHEPLLRAVAARGKPVLMSTGGSTLEECRRALAVLRDAGAHDVIVLQCTASYPAPLDALNVAAISELRLELGTPVGLSDHSREVFVAPIAAVALGAVVIEKHVTLSNELPGPDHRFALEPNEFAQLVRSIRETERARGTGHKQVLAEEEELRSFARRSVFSTRAIAAGERLGDDNIAVLRAGKLEPGAAPADFPRLLGATAARAIAANTGVQLDDVTQ
jgi:sialic acid synthase SpsE